MDSSRNSFQNGDKDRVLKLKLFHVPFIPWATSRKETDGRNGEKRIWGGSAWSGALKLSSLLFILLLSVFIYSFSLWTIVAFLHCCRATSLQAESCLCDSLLPTETLLHWKEKRDRPDSLLFSKAIISNHEQPDGDAEHLWLYRPQSPPPPPPPNASFCSTYTVNVFPVMGLICFLDIF